MMVRYNETALLADDRTMEQLALRPGQQVDEATMWRVIECNYAWLLTDVELRKAQAKRD